MSVPVFCESCGYRGISNAISMSNVRGAVLSNVYEPCPQCGGMAKLHSGTYDFVGDIMTAFRSPGMTREKIAAFRSVLEQVTEGELSSSDAVQTTEEIDPLLSRWLRAAFERGISFDRVLAVFSAILALWMAYSSDADVQAALTESRHQTELSQKILSELEKLNVSSPGPLPKAVMPQVGPAQTNVPRNRHERRKAAAIKKREKPC